MTRQFRQGDVLLRAVESIPSRATPVPSEADRLVVAEGELSGHTHSFAAAEAGLFQETQSGRLFLQVEKAAADLRHQEHAPIPVPAGHYEVRRQRQYTPGRISIRVWD